MQTSIFDQAKTISPLHLATALQNLVRRILDRQFSWRRSQEAKVRMVNVDIHNSSMHNNPMVQRELVAASAEPLVLSLLEKGENYGYALIQEIKNRSNNQLQWTDGMLYPVLHRMERKGLIKSRWGESETGRKRKYYSLKPEGKKAQHKHREQWLRVHSVLAGLWEEKYV